MPLRADLETEIIESIQAKITATFDADLSLPTKDTGRLCTCALRHVDTNESFTDGPDHARSCAFWAVRPCPCGFCPEHEFGDHHRPHCPLWALDSAFGLRPRRLGDVLQRRHVSKGTMAVVFARSLHEALAEKTQQVRAMHAAWESHYGAPFGRIFPLPHHNDNESP